MKKRSTFSSLSLSLSFFLTCKDSSSTRVGFRCLCSQFLSNKPSHRISILTRAIFQRDFPFFSTGASRVGKDSTRIQREFAANLLPESIDLLHQRRVASRSLPVSGSVQWSVWLRYCATSSLPLDLRFLFCPPRTRRFEYFPPVGKLIPTAFGQTSPSAVSALRNAIVLRQCSSPFPRHTPLSHLSFHRTILVEISLKLDE